MGIAANPRVELQLDGSNGWMGALVTETCIELLRTVFLQQGSNSRMRIRNSLHAMGPKELCGLPGTWTLSSKEQLLGPVGSNRKTW